MSREQGSFLAAVSEQGYLGVVCYGAEQAIKVISGYMDEKLDPPTP